MGFNTPSKIQETALPTLLADPPQNMIAQSQSGTGKTAAFVLAMLSRVNVCLNHPQVLKFVNKTFSAVFNEISLQEKLRNRTVFLHVPFRVRLFIPLIFFKRNLQIMERKVRLVVRVNIFSVHS